MKTTIITWKNILLIGLALVAISGLVPQPASAAENCFGDSSVKCVPTCPTDQPDCDKDPVFAKCNNNASKKTLGNCQAGTNLVTAYANPLIKALTFMVGLAVIIGIIVGGIQYSASGGDPQKAANGKKHIRNAILALMLYAILFALLQFLIPGGIFTT